MILGHNIAYKKINDMSVQNFDLDRLIASMKHVTYLIYSVEFQYFFELLNKISNQLCQAE